MHYLTADIINGVTVCEPFADSYDVLGNMDFYHALPSCVNGEILRGVVGDETFLLISMVYGIGAQ
jgi:hypothetical protein